MVGLGGVVMGTRHQIPVSFDCDVVILHYCACWSFRICGSSYFVCIVFLFCASPGFHFQSICMALLVLHACYVGVDAVSGLVILDKSV